MNARERVASLTASFDEQDAGLTTTDPLMFDGYADQLEQARRDTGLDEGCIWGWAEIGGVLCALVVFDFSFMGGSMGMVVGEKVARAFDAASVPPVPVVTVTESGGARMQEGMWSLVQMAKTVEAHRRHAEAGGAHVTLLASPTTGGVYASFASLADVVYAEAHATVGFAGPRVVQELTGEAPPPGAHTSQAALRNGLVDAVVSPDEAADAIGRALRAFTGGGGGGEPAPEPPPGATIAPSTLTAWDRLTAVRADEHPRGRAILDELLADPIELRGDRTGGPDDEHVLVRIGRLHTSGRPVVAIAQDASGDGRIRPQGFRKAVRAMAVAGRLDLPVLTVIDTRGADPSPDSEAGGVALAIARTFEAMLGCPSPTLAVLTGEGGSGGALAMAVADRVIALEQAVFSVIAPEGAAAILYRDASRAPELAEALRITTTDLVELGLVDLVVPEAAGGVANLQVSMQELTSAITAELDGLLARPAPARLAARADRWRTTASPSSGGTPGR